MVRPCHARRRRWIGEDVVALITQARLERILDPVMLYPADERINVLTPVVYGGRANGIGYGQWTKPLNPRTAPPVDDPDPPVLVP